MEVNPYAAPKARVEDAAAESGEPVYFPVGTLKLTLMVLGSLGLYQLYWFYKNWKCMQRNDNEKLLAPVRAFFYPLMSYFLFRRIRDHAASAQVDAGLAAGPLAFAVFVLAGLQRLPDPWWLLTLLSFLPLLPVQAAVNRINLKLAPGIDPNTRYSGWNIALLAVGGLLLVAAVYGTFFPEG